MTGPLAGIRVVDLGAFLAGPHTSVVLGDLGADVIKVEPPGGDPMRMLLRIFQAANRGKRSVVVDVKKPDGLAFVHRLSETVDVVHHNFRPGVAERLGVDASTLRGLNPDLVYCDTPAYGRDGPHALRGGFDQLFQAVCGHEVLGGGEGNPPMWYRIGFVDYANALLGAVAVLGGLLRRARFGGGTRVGTSSLNAGVYCLSELLRRNGTFEGMSPLDRDQTGLHPGYRLYEAADGWLAVGALTATECRALADAVGAGVVSVDPRHWGAAEAGSIADSVRARPVEEVLLALDRAGVPAERCRENAEEAILGDARLQELGVVLHDAHPRLGAVTQVGAPVSFSRSVLELRGRGGAPGVGEHTRQIASEIGYGDAEIDALFEQRVLA